MKPYVRVVYGYISNDNYGYDQKDIFIRRRYYYFSDDLGVNGTLRRTENLTREGKWVKLNEAVCAEPTISIPGSELHYKRSFDTYVASVIHNAFKALQEKMEEKTECATCKASREEFEKS